MQLGDRVKAIKGWRSGYFLLAGTLLVMACLFVDEERQVISVDAETFETIVQSQMSDSASAGFLRVDSRPAGDKDILSAPPPTSTGLDPDSSSDSVPEADVRMIVDQRKEILHDLKVEEGGPFVYPECGGFRTRRFRDTLTLHPNPECPSVFHRYVTVGLPTHGASSIVTKSRRPEVPAPDTTGDLWTVLVTETAVGPGGQQWRQYAWLFRRDQQTRKLDVAEKYLLSWAE